MSEQELARALMQQGILTAQQIQEAVKQRSGTKRFASVLIEKGWAQASDILALDPAALDNAPLNFSRTDSEPALHGRIETKVEYSSANETGLGQDAERDMDDSGVHIHGEEDRSADSGMGPIIQYVNELLKIAVQTRASDMHLEPRDDGLLPRYRVDGHLRSGGVIPAELQPPIISRLKVLSNLDITENRLPQDGRFRATIGGHVFDFRVSTLPTIYGEKIVIRLLDRSALVTDLRKLGFQEDIRDVFESMLQRSQGMILVTGPTGSGKTTTLYAALASTRDETKNVITVEDPVEYELAGVSQTNVNTDIGLSFATQLRAILRQDPDVILVGEIRDAETADIAIRAALTGHLVLSTLHTNSAVAAVTRLQDMGIAPFLLASSLSGVLAQRLVRSICRNCRTEVPKNSPEYEADIARLNLEPGFPLYHGAGCAQCNDTGMRGRLAILELLPVERELRQAIMNRTSSTNLRDIAIRHGMRTLWADGLVKLRNGLTTADEIARVLLGTEEEAAAQDATPSEGALVPPSPPANTAG